MQRCACRALSTEWSRDFSDRLGEAWFSDSRGLKRCEVDSWHARASPLPSPCSSGWYRHHVALVCVPPRLAARVETQPNLWTSALTMSVRWRQRVETQHSCGGHELRVNAVGRVRSVSGLNGAVMVCLEVRPESLLLMAGGRWAAVVDRSRPLLIHQGIPPIYRPVWLPMWSLVNRVAESSP